MKKKLPWVSKKVLIYAGLALVVLAVVLIRLNSGNGKQMATVARADVVQEVASTGKVTPNQDVDLGFDKSGRVGRVYVSVGDTVKQGQVLATLEAGEAVASLERARAALQEENIKLREMKSTAPAAFGDASKNLEAAIREGFASADNAVRNRADQFFSNVPDNPKFEISITSGNFIHYFSVPDDIAIGMNVDRKRVEAILNDWQKRLGALNSGNISSEADRAVSDLNVISSFLNKVAGAVNSFASSEYAYDATVTGYKTAMASARSEVSGAISAVVAAKDKLNASPTLGESGQFESVLAQEAKVRQAQADVSSLEASLGKSSIVAPFNGVVSVQDAKPGAAVNAGSPLISVLSPNDMYIEANISEINIGKIAVGDPVSITFDAFPGEEFSGKISYIEPGDVLVDGVVNYKVRVSPDTLDPRIKSGLTSNLNIQTAEKENVLALPLYAIMRDRNGDYVNKLVDDEVQKTPVTLGISGNDGSVEILSGLSEGDVVQY